MLLLHSISSIIVFACVFNLVAADSSLVHITTLNINVPLTDPTQYLVRGEHFALDDEEGVYYTTCRNDSNPNIHLCHVVRETLLDDAETVQIHSCADVAVPINYDDEYQSKLQFMSPFASRHVALVSGIGKDQVWIIVNLLNCSTARLQFSLAMDDFDDMSIYYAGNPIVYRDHFETVIRSKVLCDSKEPTVCRAGYNYNGTKLTPKPIQLRGSSIDYTVQPLSDDRGFYSIFWGFVNKTTLVQVSYAEPSGESRTIASVVTPQKIFSGSQISVGSNLFSVCWPFGESRNHSIRCLQTDTDKVLLDVTVKTFFDNVDLIVPFNLRNGNGILIVEWSKFDKPNFRIRWLRKDGRGIGKWLKVRSEWDEIDNCRPYSPRGIERRVGDAICIDVACHQDVGDDVVLIKHKKVCVPKSQIFHELR